MNEGPAYARSFRAPAGFGVDKELYFGFFSIDTYVSDAPELEYVLSDVTREPIRERLLPGNERRPHRRFLVDFLQSLARGARAICATAADRAAVRKLVEAARSPSHPVADREIVELFEQIRCA